MATLQRFNCAHTITRFYFELGFNFVPGSVFGTHSYSSKCFGRISRAPVVPDKKPDFKRAEFSGKVRMGFIPEEWFLFFHAKTGVSGPYLLMLSLTNYLMSKEIYICEHEYYLGLSITVMVVYVMKAFGPSIGASLDKEVDDIKDNFEKGRKQEVASLSELINECKEAQARAEGQKLLVAAKKENVAMQLEAAYRERCLLVYRAVKGRMDYHVKLYKAEARVHQKWMLGWILSNVMESITPELEKQALERAIQDLAAVASRSS